MAKTKKYTHIKRRKSRKNKRRIQKSKSFKLKGGKRGTCPLCLKEDVDILKMEHALDMDYPSMKAESKINHEMCKECFMGMESKTCPVCTRPVTRLYDPETNNVEWPVVHPSVVDMMQVALGNFPAGTQRWNFDSWAKFIAENNSELINDFYDRLSLLPPDELIKMYNSCFKFEPGIIFDDIKKKFKIYVEKQQRMGNAQVANVKPIKKSKNPDIHTIKLFLAYTLVVESELGEEYYYTRIRNLFGM